MSEQEATITVRLGEMRHEFDVYCETRGRAKVAVIRSLVHWLLTLDNDQRELIILHHGYETMKPEEKEAIREELLAGPLAQVAERVILAQKGRGKGGSKPGAKRK